MSQGVLWTTFIVMGAITFALRGAFVLFQDRIALPPIVKRALTYVPQAVLAAIVTPALFAPSGALLLHVDVRLFAGLVALVVAARSKSVVVTLGAGMGTLWILSAIANVP